MIVAGMFAVPLTIFSGILIHAQSKFPHLHTSHDDLNSPLAVCPSVCFV